MVHIVFLARDVPQEVFYVKETSVEDKIMDCSRKTPSQSLTSFRVVMRTKPSLSGPSLCSPLACSSFQAKTESCSVLWSRFLATLIVELLAEVPT